MSGPTGRPSLVHGTSPDWRLRVTPHRVPKCRKSTPIRAVPLINGETDQQQAPPKQEGETLRSVFHSATASDADATAARHQRNRLGIAEIGDRRTDSNKGIE